jgi:hypothetical protein
MIAEYHKYACRLAMTMVQPADQQQLMELATTPGAQQVKTLLSAQLPEHGIGVAPDLSQSRESESQEIYQKLLDKNTWFGPGSFVMYSIPDELNSQLLSCLPEIIKRLFPEPYIRLQILDQFQIPPHEDARTITIIVPLTPSKIETVFYDYIEPHLLFRNVAADPDLIQEVHRNTFQQHEAWLLNTKAVHATQGIESTPRVTVNFNWSGIDYQEFVDTLNNYYNEQ